MEGILMIKKDEIAYLFLRLTLGANIFLHGFSRLIGDHAAFAAYMDKQMHNAPLPGFLVHFVAIVLPWCEGTVGLLMILGLWTSVALIAGSLLMLTLQIGTCLAQNWSVAGDQLMYVLLFFVLLTYCERNRWSVDRCIKQLKEGKQPSAGLGDGARDRA
jgi:thiosulfate dehydrogenase [quinone] large subunit